MRTPIQHRRLLSFMLALLTVAVVWLSSTAANADVVLLLPARGQVPGKAVTGVLARESRYAIVEAGHKLVSDVDTDAAIRSVQDGEPDNADEFEAMTAQTHADWLVIPKILPFPPGYGLELTAYQTTSGRSETVVREIETTKIHDQVVEMVKLLLRPQGIGTDPLPWEKAEKASKAAPEDNRTETKITATGPSDGNNSLLLVGLGAGASTCVSDGCSGTVAFVGEVSGGWRALPGLVLQVDLRDYIHSGQALQAEAAVRFTVPVGDSDAIALGAEGGVGSTVTTPRVLTLRLSPVLDFGVTRRVHVQATLGDLMLMKPGSGSSFLAGGTLRGVVSF